MKHKLLNIVLLAACILGSGALAAQKTAGVSRADNEYDRLAFADAIAIYENVVRRGYSSQEILQKLGNSYYYNGLYAKAYAHYNKLFNDYNRTDIDAEYYFRYAHTLQNIGLEELSESYYDQYAQQIGKGAQVSKIRKEETFLKAQMAQNSGRYDQIENLAINTPYSDYGTFVKDDNLYFATSRDTGSLAKRVHTWTGGAFTNLYAAEESGTNARKAKRVKGVKSRFNESTAIITRDGKTMYFTRNNYLNKRGYDSEKTTKLKIYKAELRGDKWTNVTELPFNSDNFNTAHPALSPDERTLYFSSDRPGGYGLSDLWKVSIEREAYGTPVNLGPDVNTEGRETFPFVSTSNALYFSSDGRVGLGGLDVYAVQIRDDRKFGFVQNVGAPLNSPYDDFAYYIDEQKSTGFFSSNRTGGQGGDDIYSFVETRKLLLDCNQDLIIKVVDGSTGRLITDASVQLFDERYSEVGTSNRYVGNRYPFDTTYDCGDHYKVRASKEGYLTNEIAVVLPMESGVTEKTIVLEPEKEPIKVGDDLFKVLKLNPIYFDLDKYNIRPDAALELAKVFAVLEEYPDMKIDIRSHTDSRASHRYNETLSSNRARSTAQWLIDNGINRNRLTWKGYGETQLTNGCSDGVNCTEAEHQANRRSEFIVVEM